MQDPIRTELIPQRKIIYSGAVFLLIFMAVSLTTLTGCGQATTASSTMPDSSQNCGGAAVQSKYIVHNLDGSWDFQEEPDRQKFIDNYVKPNLEKIHFIEYDQRISAFQAHIDTAPSAGDAIINNWGAQAINAQVAWAAGARGQGVTVAVVDSGVDITHPQLKDQIAYNAGEMGTDANGKDKTTNQVDDDANGFIDDYAGYNFVENNGVMHDDVGHGTHVSGIIAAAHSDTTIKSGYVQGIAPGAKILPVRFLGSTNGGLLSDALKAMDYAVMRGAKIINASWGGPGCATSLQQKISDLSAANVLFVAAAGNSGVNLDLAPEYPAAYSLPLQLTIGAIADTLLQDSYSNYSKHLVHFFAPGTAIISTVPTAGAAEGSSTGYISMTGTSMATPFAVGAAAVLLSAKAGVTIQTVKAALLQTVDQNASYVNYTQGRLDLARGINAL